MRRVLTGVFLPLVPLFLFGLDSGRRSRKVFLRAMELFGLSAAAGTFGRTVLPELHESPGYG